ncbi:MAG: hypothetical protein RDV41_05295 [Planctomycetota bacterium]|nr:hypothetical protein [Planctomycetota bacterium]
MAFDLKGVLLPPDQLVSRFGVSNRMAVRANALMAARVNVTSSVLELALPGSALEKLLLTPELLDKAGTLTDGLLKELAAARGLAGALDIPLVVVDSQDGRLIALAEEAMASKACEKPRTGEAAIPQVPPALPARIQTQSVLPGIMGSAESSSIFTPAEVARLKLAVLTSVDPAQRIEALRRLAYAPLPPDEKASIFVKALADDSSDVRKEGVNALSSLGLNTTLCDALRSLSAPVEKQREVGLQKVAHLAKDANRLEQGIMLAMTLSTLRTEKSPALQRSLILSLPEFMPVFEENPEFLANLTHLLVDMLVVGLDAISTAVLTLYRSLGEKLSEPLGVLLHEEIDRVEDRRLKAFLLILVSALPKLPPDIQGRIAQEMAKNLADWSDSNLDAHRLSNALKGFGQVAVTTILDMFSSVQEPQMPFFVRLLDSICMSEKIESKVLGRLGAFLVDILKTARKATRLAILESRLCAHPGLPVEQRTFIAADFIRNAHDYRFEHIVEMTRIALDRIGPPAIDPLYKALQDSPYEIEREMAISCLGNIIASSTEVSDEFRATVDKVAKSCLGLVDDGSEQVKPLLRHVGRICAGPTVPTARVAEAVTRLRAGFKRDGANLELLEALAHVARSPNIPPAILVELGSFLIDLLNAELPQVFSREKQTPEGTLLEIGGGTEAYSTFVPTVITGLEHAALSSACSDMFRERIISNLLAKWEEITEYKIVIGPRNTILLAQTLGSIACSLSCPPHARIKITRALKKRLVHIPIIEILGKVFMVQDDSQGGTELCTEVTKELVEMLSLQDYREVEDRETLLRALARVATRPRIAHDRGESDVLRRHIVDLLFQGIGDNIIGAKDLLRGLLSCDNIPKPLKKNIKDRLARV